MDLKKLFPLSWKYSKDAANLIVGILMYLAVGIIAGVMIWLSGLIIGWIPVVGAIVGWVLRIASILVDVYVVVGIIVQILVFAKVIK
ncbi:MAG: hypothetical protein E7673_02585 [Ruminococcaceae bacterium]|nr:hypothetical protein [Oscillospiraceae bacterium]